MNDENSASNLKCPGCGKQYEDVLPSFCDACGTQLSFTPQGSAGVARAPDAGATPAVTTPAPVKPRGRRRLVIALVVTLLVIVLVAGGVVAGVLLTRGSKSAAVLPTSAEGLRESVKQCERYLNDGGKTLAAGRAQGATVYSIKARLDTVGSNISGEETFLFKNRGDATLNEIVLRVYANDSDATGGKGSAVITDPKVSASKTTANLNGSLLSVKLPQGLAPGAETVVSLSFSEQVPEVQGGLSGLSDLTGSGQSTGGYGIFGHDKNTYDLGYFMPIVARYTNGVWENRPVPQWGDPADYECAYFNVSLDVPEGFTVAAPGVQTRDSGGTGRHVYAFAAGPVRDFTAQASASYASVKRTVGATTVTSYYLKDTRGGDAKTLDFAVNALKQYNEHFGAYPYTRFNVCEAPLGGGAAGMEYAGQVQIAQMLYSLGSKNKLPNSLKDLNGDSITDLLNTLGGGLLGDTLEFTVAHEVCHQWWGLVVGSDSIDHAWQDESLANYCSVLYFKWQHGEKAAKTQLETEISLPFSAASLMGGEGDAPVDQPSAAFKNEAQYTAIIYSKGALFFQALEQKMGAAAFDKSLGHYYDEYAFLNATPDDLVQAFESNSADAPTVAALHERWIKETHAAEDITSTLPGADLLNNLLKQVPGGENLDLGPLQDLLKQYMNDGGPSQDNGSPLPTSEPNLTI